MEAEVRSLEDRVDSLEQSLAVEIESRIENASSLDGSGLEDRIESVEDRVRHAERCINRLYEVRQKREAFKAEMRQAGREVAKGTLVAVLCGFASFTGVLANKVLEQGQANMINTLDGTQYQLVQRDDTKPGCNVFDVFPKRGDVPVATLKFPARCKP
jgi:hypothetical protein